MKNSNNIFLGSILVLIGIILLGLVNHWFSFKLEFRDIARFWPLLIILAGVAVLLDPKRKVWNPTTLLLVLMAIPAGIFSFADNKINKVKNEFNKEFDFDINIDEDNELSISRDDTSAKQFDHKTFKVDNNQNVKTAELKISGGAAQFVLDAPETQQLFLADTKLAKNTDFSLKDNIENSTAKIDSKMKGTKNIRIGDDGLSKKVSIRLNDEPIWKIKMDIGAGDLKYDLTPYKVEEFKIETGASNIDLKLGDLVNNTKVNIKSGVANVVIKVPESAGCEIIVDGALNSKNFTGFTKISSRLYRTEGFDSASKKIYIDTDSGMSNLVISRY